MDKFWFWRTVLLVAVVFGLVALAPLQLVAEVNSYLQTTTASVNAFFQTDLKLNLARQNFDYPGELMLAANLVPVANYFCFALRQVSLNGFKTKDCKVIGMSLRGHLASTVIFMFYIFYRNSRTSSEEDPHTFSGFWTKI